MSTEATVPTTDVDTTEKAAPASSVEYSAGVVRLGNIHPQAGAGSGVEALGWVTVSLSWVGSMASVLVVVTICLVSRAFPGLGSVPIAHCLARGCSSARTCDV